MQNYLHDEDKGVREETFFLIFRWNFVLHDSYQPDEILKEIEEWKQRVPGVCQKLYQSFIECVGNISFILKNLISLLYITDMITVLKLAPIVISSSQE